MQQKIKAQETVEPIGGVPAISVGDGNVVFANLAASLAEIRKLKGVSGYILRGSTSAVVDLIEQDKIMDYALLSTEISEASRSIAKQFNLADIENVLVEGKDVKVLSMSVGENRMSIFMDKTAAHSWIIKRILL